MTDWTQEERFTVNGDFQTDERILVPGWQTDERITVNEGLQPMHLRSTTVPHTRQWQPRWKY